MAKTTKLYFRDLGIEMEVEVSKLQEARLKDKRGYAVFNATDSEGDEVAINSVTEGHSVPVSILLNDTTVKSKGASKSKKKILA